MPKVKIDRSEYYPYYDLDSDFGKEVKISEEQMTRWNKASSAFEQIQREFAKLWEDDDNPPIHQRPP